MQLGRCCKCGGGLASGFWVRPSRIVRVDLDDIGDETVVWEPVYNSGALSYYRYTDSGSLWTAGQTGLCYGVRYQVDVPTAENEEYAGEYTTSTHAVPDFPFAVSDVPLTYASFTSLNTGGLNGILALSAMKSLMCHPRVPIKSALIEQLVHPLSMAFSSTHGVQSYRIAYYRVLHDGVPVTDILRGFDETETTLIRRPVGVGTFDVQWDNTNPSLLPHTQIDDTSPDDDTYINSIDNTAAQLDIAITPTYHAGTLSGHTVVIRVCESRNGLLTTESDTPSGVTLEVRLRTLFASGYNILVGTINVPVVPTTYTFNIPESDIASIPDVASTYTTLPVIRVLTNAVPGAGCAITQIYSEIPSQWFRRITTNLVNTGSYPFTEAPRLAQSNAGNPVEWHLPENIRSYYFSPNVQVSLDIWYELVKRSSSLTMTTVLGGVRRLSTDATERTDGVVGFGVQYETGTDKTKHTYRFTMNGNTWRPLIAIGDTVEISNMTSDATSTNIVSDTYARTSVQNSAEDMVGHGMGIYYNSEIPTVVVSGRMYVPLDTDENNIEVTKSLYDTSPLEYTWKKLNTKPNYWSPGRTTTFHMSNGVELEIGGTLPTFTPASEPLYPTTIIVKRIAKKGKVVRLYKGSSSFVVPAASFNVTQVTFECWGAGGGLGGSHGTFKSGGAGGGGAYSRLVLDVEELMSFSLQVGAAGTVGTYSLTPTAGGDGGNTWISYDGNHIVEAEGGKGGGPASLLTGGTAGVGGQATNGIGDVRYSGGNGFTSDTTSVHYGGGSGGWESDGNTPSAASKYPVAVKHGSGGDNNGVALAIIWLKGMGGSGLHTSGNVLPSQAGMIRISYDYSDV